MATVVLRGDRVLSTDKAIATYKFLAKIKPSKGYVAGPGRGKKGLMQKNKSSNLFDGPNPDELREAGEAYQKYGSRTPDRSGSGVVIDGARISKLTK